MSEIRKYCENCSHSEYGFAESSLNQYYTCGLVDKIVEEDDTCDKFVHYPTKIKKLESDLQKAIGCLSNLFDACRNIEGFNDIQMKPETYKAYIELRRARATLKELTGE